jgi:DNA-binding beta-propeller fold protein YncE
MNARRALKELRAPDEPAAQERALTVVRAAYAERAPVRRQHSRVKLVVVPVVILLLGAATLSPAGATVTRWIKHALGVPHASPALFRLPAAGSLLVSGAGGTWTVAADGSSRRLGPWRAASWSPRGLFVAVTRPDALAAVDPHGTLHWALARPAVSDPRWYPPTGYRVAYLSGHTLRVVAGDGTGDRLLAQDVAAVAPSWQPGHAYRLAYAAPNGSVVVRDADTDRVIWSVRPEDRPHELAWSSDGTELLVTSASTAQTYDQRGRPLASVSEPSGSPILDAALSPDGREVGLVRGGTADDVVIAALAAHPAAKQRRVLSGAGLRQLAWSPDGRWLLVSWPAADQLVFVRVAGRPRIAAASRIARQFATRASARVEVGAFPRLEGWCCTATGSAG